MRTSRMPEDIYEKQSKRESGGSKLPAVLLFLLIAGLIAVTVFAGGWLSDNVITPVAAFFSGDSEASGTDVSSAGTQTIKLPTASYYLLQSGVYDDEVNAQEAASMMADRGGAGYVLQDNGRRRVLLCAYMTESDAKEVRDRLASEQAVETYVYTLTVPAYSVTLDATPEQAETVKAALSLTEDAVRALIAISEDHDRGSDVTPDMDMLKNTAQQMRSRVERELGAGDGAARQLADYCRSVCDDIIALPDDLSEKTAESSSALKYGVLSVIDEYSQFVSGLK